MKELQDFSKSIQKRYKYHKMRQSRVWQEFDTLNGKKTRSLTIIIQTTGCKWASHSGCTMCGYFRDSLPGGIDEIQIISQVDKALERYAGESIIKIFTSGSFLDPKEISFHTQKKILKKMAKRSNVKKISIESRPEYVTDKIEELAQTIKPIALEVSIGLESANDQVLEKSINKGFLFNDWLKAARYIHEHNLNLKTYLLIKPPFLTEREAIADCIRSAEKILDLSTTISFNPVNIHSYTVLEWLWKRGEYQPPWLWSIISILKEVHHLDGKTHIQCDIIAGGQKRGAHNCGKCDKKILECINNFSLFQNEKFLVDIDCECKKKWKGLLEMEGFAKGFYF
jgi:radical SAM enzyme (TIGR01210 family)